ncbi:MAG: universal stress protein [Burkholderiaceae bacterium]|nr:universal stress protein [Microbacteriaceae bacterium]
MTSSTAGQTTHPIPADAIHGVEPVPVGSIVVGHDGSADGRRSLAAAFELAEKFVAPLVVVRTWGVDSVPAGTLVDHGIVSSFAEITAKVLHELQQETSALVASHPGVEVIFRVVQAQAAATLLTLSADARVLVVGSRGLGGFASLLLGSVSEQCVRHASCPVLVVRPSKTRGE